MRNRSRRIPDVLHFNYRRNLLTAPWLFLSLHERMLLLNVRRTIELHPGATVNFFDDAECRSALGQHERHGAALAMAFDNETDGRLRSDMCRLAMLRRTGGLYFDTDLGVRGDVRRVLSARTTFAVPETWEEPEDWLDGKRSEERIRTLENLPHWALKSNPRSASQGRMLRSAKLRSAHSHDSKQARPSGCVFFDGPSCILTARKKPVGWHPSRTPGKPASRFNPPGFFQAFMAVAPAHPLIESALDRHVRWYAAMAARDEKEIYRVTHFLEKPNVGTVLLRDAFIDWAHRSALREGRARGLVKHETDGHVSQLFFEAPGSHKSLRGWRLPVGHVRLGLCSYVVADVRSHVVLFLSRISHPKVKGVCSWGGGQRVITRPGVAPVPESRAWRAWSDPERDIRHVHKELADAVALERLGCNALLAVAGSLTLLGLWSRGGLPISKGRSQRGLSATRF